MEKALIINCSPPYYNLAAHKLKDYLSGQGYRVDRVNGDPGALFTYGYDLVCLSVIFSWHAPHAASIANRVKSYCEVWAGGPGLAVLGKWWHDQTGLSCVTGLDWRFERQRGHYRMTFASRGCDVNCPWCIVPIIEKPPPGVALGPNTPPHRPGAQFTLDPDFVPAPILCDNNLSGLPEKFQWHILQRYQQTRTILKDANSGFEPRSFNLATRQRWEPQLRGPWRFALDEMAEYQQVKEMMYLLRDRPSRDKRVYVLIANEPIRDCYERVRAVIRWRGQPFVQVKLPLNYLGGPLHLGFDWTERKAKDFARWADRYIWRTVPLREYNPRQSDYPFAALDLPPLEPGTKENIEKMFARED